MPYIPKSHRPELDKLVDRLVLLLELEEPGEINYVISRLIWSLFAEKNRYVTANTLLGVLEAVKLEFYRRIVAPYEEGARSENGDIEI